MPSRQFADKLVDSVMPEVPWDKLPHLTLLIRSFHAGEPRAEERLFRLTYPHLKQIAERVLRRSSERRGLSPLDLLHDVYLSRLRNWRGEICDRGHYRAVVISAMRNQLVDRARRARSLKRSAPTPDTGFPQQLASKLSYEEILALERELDRLRQIDPRAAEVVCLRYYCGCSWEETAAAVGATVKIVRRDWEFVAEWLGTRLGHRRS